MKTEIHNYFRGNPPHKQVMILPVLIIDITRNQVWIGIGWIAWGMTTTWERKKKA